MLEWLQKHTIEKRREKGELFNWDFKMEMGPLYTRGQGGIKIVLS